MKFYQYPAYIALFVTAMQATPLHLDAGPLPGDVHINGIRGPTIERRQLVHNGTVYCNDRCGWPDHHDCASGVASIFNSVGYPNCPPKEYSESETGFCGISYEMEPGQDCIDQYYFYLGAQAIFQLCSQNSVTGFSGGCYLYEQSTGYVGSAICMWDPSTPCFSGDI